MSTSSAHSTVSGSLPTLPIHNSNTTSPQPSNFTSASSTHSSEPERNNALSSLDCLRASPVANSNLPPSASTSALPSSAYSDPETCTSNNETSSREKMASEIEYIFDLFPLIPLPKSTELPSPGVAQPLSAEQGVHMSTSSAHSTVSGSLPTLPIHNSNTTSPQPSNFTSASSTHFSEPERNNALHALLDDKMCSRGDTMASGEMTPSIFDLPLFLFPLTPLSHSTDLQSQGVSQPASIEQVADTLHPLTSTAQSHLSSLDCLRALSVANSNLPPSPMPNTTALPSSAYPDPKVCTVNENTNREKMASEMGCFFDLFPLIPHSDLLSQGVSQPTLMEQGADMLQPPTSTAPPHLLPGEKVTNMCRDKISPSRQCSHSSTPEDEDITSVCTHINPDSPGTPAERLCIQSASTEQSKAGSFSPVPPSAVHLNKNEMTEKFSTETSSQMEVDSSVKAHNCMKKKQKLGSVVQQRQRRLNKVCALHYRQRRKERESELAVRMEQLEAENTRLKEHVSALTTEIDKMKKKLLQKTQKTKVCPFFLHSTCSKLN